MASLSPSVAIFGASWCQPGSPLYTESEVLGKALVDAGYRILNGGYGGTMEGSSKGARSSVNHGDVVEGVIVRSLFKQRNENGNEYLTTVTDTPSLLTRIEHILLSSDYFVVMPGTLGTLAEAVLAWNTASLSILGTYTRPRIFLYRKPWFPVIEACNEGLNLPKEHRDLLQFADDAAEIVKLIQADIAERQFKGETVRTGRESYVSHTQPITRVTLLNATTVVSGGGGGGGGGSVVTVGSGAGAMPTGTSQSNKQTKETEKKMICKTRMYVVVGDIVFRNSPPPPKCVCIEG